MTTLYGQPPRPDHYQPRHRRSTDLPAFAALGCMWFALGVTGVVMTGR